MTVSYIALLHGVHVFFDSYLLTLSTPGVAVEDLLRPNLPLASDFL